MIVPTLLGITVIVFAISRIAPGDPVSSHISSRGEFDVKKTIDVRKERLKLYGLDKPIHIQYVNWLWRVTRLDFGQSVKHNRPVIKLIADRLPITLTLNLIALVFIYAISLPTGVLAAVKHGRFFDRAISVFFLVLWSLPIMWVGQMLIGYFAGPAFKSWFPPAGISSIYADRLSFFQWLFDRLWHLALPVVCLTYTGFAYLSKQVRAEMLENLSMDYVRTARAKGLPESAVIFRHVFRNSLVPVITITASLFPAVFAGSVIVEKIFSIPGMGLLMFEAVANRDYNVVMALATIAGILNMIALLLADIAYALADPRVTFEGNT